MVTSALYERTVYSLSYFKYLRERGFHNPSGRTEHEGIGPVHPTLLSAKFDKTFGSPALQSPYEYSFMEAEGRRERVDAGRDRYIHAPDRRGSCVLRIREHKGIRLRRSRRNDLEEEIGYCKGQASKVERAGIRGVVDVGGDEAGRQSVGAADGTGAARDDVVVGSDRSGRVC